LNLKVRPHEVYKREGLDIISEVPLSITEAILGCKITIETLDGRFNVEVKPGTNSGSEIRLKHHGMPPFHPPDNYDVNQLRGDHIIRLKIVLPSNLSPEQERIMRDFKEQERANKEKFY
jgi:DnaJ-class molecular chaperone